MLRSFSVSSQLAASQEGLSSMSDAPWIYNPCKRKEEEIYFSEGV
jgi:hypothetical protein